jgi:putative methylase
MRRAELVRLLQQVPGFSRPRADLEQVVTPAEAAATLLETAERIDGLSGRSVLDLGTGTGRLAIGAATLGARPVRGVEVDAAAVELARGAARSLGADVRFTVGQVRDAEGPAEIVVMNPPFGAQRRHADRPFWERAFALAGRSVYAFALRDSRTFIGREAVARQIDILEVAPVPWSLGRTFPHHDRARVALEVDLWALRTANGE